MLLKQEARDRLLSVDGIEMRVNRSIQVEGVFSAIKQDMSYDRLRRTTLPKAEMEMMLVCLGYNIRKYMRFLSGKAQFKFRHAPVGTSLKSSRSLRRSVWRSRWQGRRRKASMKPPGIM